MYREREYRFSFGDEVLIYLACDIKINWFHRCMFKLFLGITVKEVPK